MKRTTITTTKKEGEDVPTKHNPRLGEYYYDKTTAKCALYVVARTTVSPKVQQCRFALICVASGDVYSDPAENIKDIFAEDDEDFVLVNRVHIDYTL